MAAIKFEVPTTFNVIFALQICFAECLIDGLLIAVYQYEVQRDSALERLLSLRPPYIAPQYGFLFFLLPQNHDLIKYTNLFTGEYS